LIGRNSHKPALPKRRPTDALQRRLVRDAVTVTMAGLGGEQGRLLSPLQPADTPSTGSSDNLSASALPPRNTR